jgi:small GTP-binding protein
MKTKTKIIIVGDQNTGKTQLVFSKRNIHHKPDSTIGASYYDFDEDSFCWDMSGHSQWAHLYPLYYRNAPVFIVVFDLTNKKSFKHINEYISKINECCSEKPLIILVGNKADLTEQRVVSSDEVNQLTQKLEEEENRISYVQTSALKGTGVELIFSIIAKQPINEMEPSDEDMAAVYLANRRDEIRTAKNTNEHAAYRFFMKHGLMEVRDNNSAELNLMNVKKP